MKKLLLALLGVLMALPTMAKTFEYSYEGQTLTYFTTSHYTCEVVSPRRVVSGYLVIPSIVSHESEEYMVTEIRDGAFRACTSLTGIFVPSTVTSIGAGAFSCISLREIHVDIDNPCYSSIDGVLFNKDHTALIQFPATRGGDYTIPSSVTEIGDYAFYNCSGLTSIDIPASLLTIGWSAFYDCSGLTSIDIPDSLLTIGGSAFYHCSGLTSIDIPTSVTTIGMSTFLGCTSLSTITIPSSIKEIRDDAFWGCSSLTSVSIPSVTTIGEGAFDNCRSLTSIEMPSVTEIGEDAFWGCSSLTSIEMPSVTEIGIRAFCNCDSLINVEMPSVMTIGRSAFWGCDSLINVEMSSVMTIGGSAFERCYSLINVEIPSVTEIGDDAFRDCSGLTSVEIPSVTEIGEGVFHGCSNLTSIDIPSSVTTIGKWAFGNCNGLTSVYYNAEDPKEFNSVVFGTETYERATLYVPAEAVNKAKQINPWCLFANIQAYSFNGIEDIEAADSSEIDYSAPYEVFGLNGSRLSGATDTLAPGIYIIRQGNKTKKIAVQ